MKFLQHLVKNICIPALGQNPKISEIGIPAPSQPANQRASQPASSFLQLWGICEMSRMMFQKPIVIFEIPMVRAQNSQRDATNPRAEFENSAVLVLLVPPKLAALPIDPAAGSPGGPNFEKS